MVINLCQKASKNAGEYQDLATRSELDFSTTKPQERERGGKKEDNEVKKHCKKLSAQSIKLAKNCTYSRENGLRDEKLFSEKSGAGGWCCCCFEQQYALLSSKKSN